MGDSGLPQKTTAFAAAAAALVTSFFALMIFAAVVILQYGVRSVDFGWQGQRLGDDWYVGAIATEGPAQGILAVGDRVVGINGEAVSGLPTLVNPLNTLAGSDLYAVEISRSGQAMRVWLRPLTRTGSSFFRERLPLLGASVLFFIAGLSMLLNWNSASARLGFLASMFAALRMGAWAILPLSAFFDQSQYHTFFLFWLPAGLAPALAFHSLLMLSKPAQHWQALGGVIYSLWGVSVVPLLLAKGAIPAPVPDGFAVIYIDRVEYVGGWPVIYLLGPIYLSIAAIASTAWVVNLYRGLPEGDGRSRLAWLIGAGFVFGIPAVGAEICRWLGMDSNAIRWTWAGALMALTYGYVIGADRLMSPAMTIRWALSTVLPERLFQTLDRMFFPESFAREASLRGMIEDIRSCRSQDLLPEVTTKGLQAAFGMVDVRINREAPPEEMIEVGPRPDGGENTRREEKLIQKSLVTFAESVERLSQALPPPSLNQAMNLLRECPECGTCFDSDVVRCPRDGKVPVVTLPVDRIVDSKYRLERLIGRGGMGAVYAGRDLRLDRKIAIKVLLSELFGQEVALRRFEREAQTVARLNHLNIIQVHDYGPIGAMGAYLVMEYCEGRTWRDELRASTVLRAPAITALVAQLLDGVAAAHEAGVIHRDLKPENILLVDRGDGTTLVKILDFGLAKMQLLDFSRDDRLSIGVNMIGTVGYVPPEQLTGGRVDPRSDVYAIGRILIETLSGSLPEPGTAAGVEGPLSAILCRCTAIDREQRFNSVAELRTALLPALANSQVCAW